MVPSPLGVSRDIHGKINPIVLIVAMIVDGIVIEDDEQIAAEKLASANTDANSKNEQIADKKMASANAMNVEKYSE